MLTIWAENFSRDISLNLYSKIANRNFIRSKSPMFCSNYSRLNCCSNYCFNIWLNVDNILLISFYIKIFWILFRPTLSYWIFYRFLWIKSFLSFCFKRFILLLLVSCVSIVSVDFRLTILKDSSRCLNFGDNLLI